MHETQDDLQIIQTRIDRLLRRGVIFSILWLMGIGSAIALYSAVKARRLIASADGQVTGTSKVWLCFILGGFGIALWGTVIVVGIFNNLK